MRILLTGANGYIGKRLLPLLLSNGHEVIAVVRDKRRFEHKKYNSSLLSVIEVDFLNENLFKTLPPSIDVAYYLIHSLDTSINNFNKLETQAAKKFLELIAPTSVKQIVYLSGISHSENLSQHLSSRLNVETILSKSKIPITTLRAGIIVGSGSASFEIIRDLVEKLPIMITPKWLNTKCQPIAIRNVIDYLIGVLLKNECLNQSFDIGGPEILTYKQMLLQYAEVREIKRFIFTLPIMTPKLSSYWLYFVTSTSFFLAVNLVNSMKVEVVCQNNNIHKLIPLELFDYKTSIQRAFKRIAQNMVLSSWKDAMVAGHTDLHIGSLVEVPTYGCYFDRKKIKIKNKPDQVLDNIWSIGGERGWYYATWLWRLRGFIDRLAGGVGLRRGKTNLNNVEAGDSLDFWRVIYADKNQKRLLLFAEMILPGEAWLEFKISSNNFLIQTATFRPKGILGRTYWYLLLPFHFILFKRMIRNVERFIPKH